MFVVGNLECGAGAIDLRFGKNQLGGIADEVLADAVDFVALDDAQGFETGECERLLEIGEQVAGLDIVGRKFFDKNAVHWQEAVMLGHEGVRASRMGFDADDPRQKTGRRSEVHRPG